MTNLFIFFFFMFHRIWRSLCVAFECIQLDLYDNLGFEKILLIGESILLCSAEVEVMCLRKLIRKISDRFNRFRETVNWLLLTLSLISPLII